jgi:hypothetical protein
MILVEASKAEKLQEMTECSISKQPMLDGVSLLPCGHPISEEMALKMARNDVEPEGKDGLVRFVTPVTCPLDQRPATHYAKNFFCRHITKEITEMFERPIPFPMPSDVKECKENKEHLLASTPPTPRRGPYYTWPQRFGMAVSTALASAGAIYAPIHQFYNTAPKVSDPRWEFWKGWIPGVIDYSIRDNNVKVATITSIMTMSMALMCFTVTACILAKRNH